ncbi:Clavaminate synthase-like protein At3g21360 [hydrothermal vent metagenome]|uniref:Clavaminate synthase-like protein At3g21360 n=1 Tax=hydrothermal vent metagenome TaxID=652676 RepID=A0A3B1DPB4_9ZZZZ
MTHNLTNSLNVSAISFPTQQTFGDTVFPYLIKCESPDASLQQTIDWTAENATDLLELSYKHGAILFRGFPFTTVEEFDPFIAAFGLPNFPYKKSLSNAVRVNRTERIFSANEAPSEVDILYHHEMAQTPFYPKTIFFCCEVAADEGGATSLCRSDILLERLEEEYPEFVQNCEELGLKYFSVMPLQDDAQSGMGRSWKSTLGVETKEDAETRLKELNYTWEWLDDDSLRATTPTLPCIREVTENRKTFFNQLIAAFCGWKDSRNDPSEAIRFGDGSKLDTAAVMRAVALSEELTFDLDWQVGDIALVDNTLIMHGRQPFKGTRKVFASLACAEENLFQLQHS